MNKQFNRLYSIFFVLMFLCSTLLVNAENRNFSAKQNINIEAVMKGVEKYNNVIIANPESEDGYINRAFLNYLLGNLDLAIQDYNKLLSLNPNEKEYYLNRGYLHHLSNNRLEALKDYNSALRIDPNYVFAHNNRGVVLAELGKNEESMQAYNTALKINPQYSDAYYNRGNLNTKINKNEEAIKDFDAAISLNPKDAASFNNRGVVKRKLNYNIGALSDFSIAIRLDPDDITAYSNRGHLKKRYFDSEGAEEDFKIAVKLAEDSPELIQQIEKQKDIEAYQKPALASATPPSVTYKSAPAELNKALRMPKVDETHIQKIALRTAINDNVKAPNAVKAGVVKVEPKKETVAAVKETVKPHNVATQNVTPQRVASQSTAPQIDTKPVVNPKLAECYYIRALQKYIIQNRQGALSDFNLALQHNPNYAEAYYYRAAIKRDLQDNDFINDYKKAISLKPDLKTIADANVLMILK